MGGGSVTSAPVSVQVDNALSAAERVLADDTKGRLTPDEFALYGVYAVGSVWSLPPRYQSDTASKGFVDDAQFTANLEDLKPATRMRLTPFLPSPTEAKAISRRRMRPSRSATTSGWTASTRSSSSAASASTTTSPSITANRATLTRPASGPPTRSTTASSRTAAQMASPTTSTSSASSSSARESSTRRWAISRSVTGSAST